MKFAVIATGGKQYLVQEGDTLKIEKIMGTHKAGDTLTFNDVLLVAGGNEAKIGNPTVSGASVTGKLVKHGRAPKVTVIKYKAKSRYFKKRGHRQPFFEIKIESIK